MKRARRRKLRLSLIRKRQSYYVPEITKLLGVSKMTVRNWAKAGLTIYPGKPFPLVHGGELHAFLTERKRALKQKCQSDEMYCMRCRQPRKPFGLMVDVVQTNDKWAQVKGLCEECDARMNRRCWLPKLTETLSPFDHIRLLSQTLAERLPTSLNYHF